MRVNIYYNTLARLRAENIEMTKAQYDDMIKQMIDSAVSSITFVDRAGRKVVASKYMVERIFGSEKK